MNDTSSVMNDKRPSTKPPTTSLNAIHQNPGTSRVSGRQHRMPNTWYVGVCPRPHRIKPQITQPMTSVTTIRTNERK